MIEHRILKILFAVLASATPWVGIPTYGQDIIDDSRDALSELIETRRFIAESKNEWAIEKQIIEDTVGTLQRQIEGVENTLKSIEDTTTAAEDRRSELQTKIEELEEILAYFEPLVSEYEARLRDLKEYLPRPLLEKSGRLFDQLPKEGEKGSRRLLNNRAVVVIALLDEINNFKNSIQVHPQLLAVNGQTEREFSVLYYGLSSAYFVDENETVAGIGKPAKGEWSFEIIPGIESEVFDAVQIKEKKLLARFVSLPINIETINP